MTREVPARFQFLRQMAERYCWDMRVADALADERRIVRRVMDLGVIEDILELERVLDREELVATLQRAPAGSLRPRSWAFWHYRLRLIDPENMPPPMPERRFA